MDRLIEIIEGELKTNLGFIETKKEKDEEYKKRIAILEEIKKHPGKIVDNPDEFYNAAIINKNSIPVYIQALFNLSDMIEEFRNESQIQKVLEYLDFIISERIEYYKKEINDKTYEEEAAKYTRALELLKNYNSDTYLSPEDIELIKESVFSVYDINNDLLKFLCMVMINNAKIEELKALQSEEKGEIVEKEEILEKKDEEIEPLPKEVVTSMEKKRKRFNKSASKEKKELAKRKKYIKKIDEIFSSDFSSYPNHELISSILSKALDALKDSESEIDFDLLEDKEVDYSFISAMSSYNDLYVLFAISFAGAYKYKEHDVVKAIIKEYYLNPLIDVKDFLDYAGKHEVGKILTRLENLGANDQNESARGYNLHTYISNYIDQDGISEGDRKYHLEFCFKILYNEINDLIKDRDADSLNSIELDNLVNVAKTILNEYSKYIPSDEEEKDPIEDFYGPDAKNFFVIFDLDKFDYSYQKVRDSRKEYPIAKDVFDKIKDTIPMDQQTLISDKVSHNVKMREQKDNPYEILELRGGDTRVTFKVVGSKKYVTLTKKVSVGNSEKSDFNIIVLFQVGFGRLQGKKKASEIQPSVRAFEANPERYNELVEIFLPENNKDGFSEKAREEIIRAIEEFKKIQTDILDISEDPGALGSGKGLK